MHKHAHAWLDNMAIFNILLFKIVGECKSKTMLQLLLLFSCCCFNELEYIESQVLPMRSALRCLWANPISVKCVLCLPIAVCLCVLVCVCVCAIDKSIVRWCCCTPDSNHRRHESSMLTIFNLCKVLALYFLSLNGAKLSNEKRLNCCNYISINDFFVVCLLN